jgi:glycine/D-amino acid oxidase-like deaminating enzyme
VALLERDQICSGGTAKSCAICRTHYSIASNTALTVKTLEMFAQFKELLEDDEAESGFVKSGYLILAPAGDYAGKLQANLVKQNYAGADTRTISREEALERHPWLQLDDVAAIGFEPNSGYADPYLTTSSFIRAAQRLGVAVKPNTQVHGLRHQNDRIYGVETETGLIETGMVVTATGPWSAPLLATAGINIPLKISRHSVLTFKAEQPYGRMLPVVKDLTTDNKMYFRPASGDVVLVGTGDYGDPVRHADAMNENIASAFIELQGSQLARRMAAFADGALTASWIGPYDITPDWNPVLGPVEGIKGLHVAFGFSGHGFKLAPAIGLMLAQTVLGEIPEIGLYPYRLGRFATGELLSGSYGIGSIS